MIALSGVTPKQYYVTAEGAKELERLLASLQRDRVELAEEARKLASQSSSSELDDSALVFNQSRANELDAQIALVKCIIARAKLISQPVDNRQVQLGSQVVISMNGTRQTYSIVGPLEVDPAQGKISDESPLGQLLLGKKVKDSFEMRHGGQLVPASIARIS